MEKQQVDHQQESPVGKKGAVVLPMREDPPQPELLDYENRRTAEGLRPTIAQESYKIAIGVGVCIVLLALIPIVSEYQDGSISMLWHDRDTLVKTAVFMGVTLSLGAAVIWLGFRSRNRSRAAAYVLCGFFATLALAAVLIVLGVLMYPGTGDDKGAAILGAVFSSVGSLVLLFLAWIHFAWARQIAAADPSTDRS